MRRFELDDRVMWWSKNWSGTIVDMHPEKNAYTVLWDNKYVSMHIQQDRFDMARMVKILPEWYKDFKDRIKDRIK